MSAMPPRATTSADARTSRPKIPEHVFRDVLVENGFHCPVCLAHGAEPQRQVLELAHVVPWSQGGPHTRDNLLPLCSLHHREMDRDLTALNASIVVAEWSGTRGRLTLDQLEGELEAQSITSNPPSTILHFLWRIYRDHKLDLEGLRLALCEEADCRRRQGAFGTAVDLLVLAQRFDIEQCRPQTRARIEMLLAKALRRQGASKAARTLAERAYRRHATTTNLEALLGILWETRQLARHQRLLRQHQQPLGRVRTTTFSPRRPLTKSRTVSCEPPRSSGREVLCWSSLPKSHAVKRRTLPPQTSRLAFRSFSEPKRRFTCLPLTGSWREPTKWLVTWLVA